MESHAGPLVVFLLLEPSGLFRQQLAELQISFAQSIDLGGFDAIANESQNRRTPFVTLCFVLADVRRVLECIHFTIYEHR